MLKTEKPSDLLSTGEFAALIGMSRQSVNRYIAEGLISPDDYETTPRGHHRIRRYVAGQLFK